MLRMLSFILLINLIFAKEIPISLAEEISKETAVFTRIPSEKWQEVGYRGITTKLSDAVVDDSGNIHLIIDEHYRPHKHIWSYLRYDKNGNRLFKKEIYSANYVTITQDLLVSRILVNPDMTILIFYPDAEFYTCWVKLDQAGNVIEKNEPRWWHNDASFSVCSAGQDSLHIISFPVGFSGQLIKQYDSMMGEIYLRVDPVIMPVYHYSNNFSLKEQRVFLRVPYKTLGVSGWVPLPDKRTFCFSNCKNYVISWVMDSKGNCYDGEKFDKKKIDKVCFAKVTIDTMLSRLDIIMLHKSPGIAISSHNTINVGLYAYGSIYLLKYDLNGKIIQRNKGTNKLVKISEMTKDETFPFITQMINTNRFITETGVFNNTIFYWGFDDLGNFFLQIY